MNSNIAIIGVGNIGSRLAKRFTEHGISVTLAATDLASAQEVAAKLGEKAQAATVDEGISGADIVIGAIPFGPLLEFAKENREKLAGKIFADPSNNFRRDESGNASNANPDGLSAGMQVQEALGADVRYVKAFGTMAAFELERTEADSGGKNVSPYATDDVEAGEQIGALIREAGWDTVRIGGVADTARIEVLGDLHPFGGLQSRLLTLDEFTKLI
ncbi:MAG: NAD(P)-binding domain-containing protein [Arcanobacterium sp.]|nr:NAD(P)-binding domain-containing protein [Arcanobacterium sp.]